MSIELPTLDDAKAEHLLRAAWQLGDMTPEWIAAFLRDVLPQHNIIIANRALRSIADILDNADTADTFEFSISYLDDAISHARKVAADERELANSRRLVVVR